MKLTLTGLKEFSTAYVKAASQAGKFTPSTNNFVKMVDKIGKQITIDGEFNDKLPELSGEDLPLGKTVEEYMIDLTLPIDYNRDTAAEGTLKPYLPSVEEVCYSVSLGKKVIPTTIPYNDVERACVNAGVAGNVIAKIMERFAQSFSMYQYAVKKQLLGNMAAKAVEAELYSDIAPITDTVSGESFIKLVKKDVEDAGFANEGHCLSKALIGATPSSNLVLYVKKGVMPEIEVEVQAGAFNGTAIALPCRIKVVDDFGDQDITAMLVDDRGVKLHRDYHAIRSQEVGLGDYINYFDHSENTGFISKFTFVKVYKNA